MRSQEPEARPRPQHPVRHSRANGNPGAEWGWERPNGRTLRGGEADAAITWLCWQKDTEPGDCHAALAISATQPRSLLGYLREIGDGHRFRQDEDEDEDEKGRWGTATGHSTVCGKGNAEAPCPCACPSPKGRGRVRGSRFLVGGQGPGGAYRTTSGASISPFAKAARKALTTFGSNSVPEPFAMIALASKGDMAFR